MSDEQTAAAYARSGWGGRLRWGRRPAVLVVDLVRGFTDDRYSLGSDLTDEVEATARVLGAAREADVPVLFTTIAFDDDLADAGIWPQKCTGLAELVRGSDAVAVDDRLGRRPGEPVVEKQGVSAFFGTVLTSLLVARGVDTVILCGASTSGCIRGSAVDALQLGYACVVPRQCVGDRSRAQHEANLFDMDAKYADVVDLDVVLDHLRSLAL